MDKAKEKIAIYLLLSIVVIGLIALLISGIGISQGNYARGVEMAESLFNEMTQGEEGHYRPDVAMLYSLQYSRALDAATIKYVAVFLGYLIVLIGAIFVLYGAQAFYKLKAEKADVKSSLETSSPGLVLVTLGAALVVVALFNKSTYEVNVEWPIPPTVIAAPLTSDADSGDSVPQETIEAEYETIEAP